MTITTTRRLAAAALAGASLLAIAGFTALGSVFEYPQILQEPTADILELFRANQSAVTLWFGILVLGAALLAPAGYLLGRIAGGTTGRWITITGVAAAVVQVIGLSRWVLFIPGVSDDALVPANTAEAHRTFELLHRWLGVVVGETIGYVLTAAFTVLVVRGVARSMAPRWLAIVGDVAAVLIVTGVLVPVLHLASLTNFAGYVLWCCWVLGMAVVLWRGRAVATSTTGGSLSAERASSPASIGR